MKRGATPHHCHFMEFKLVKRPEDADANAILVTLFKCPLGYVRGWYVGPMLRLKDGGKVPYVPRSQGMFGMVAALRGYQTAAKLGVDCYLIDPENLWDALSHDGSGGPA